jgi:hypothetical protein
VKPIYVIAAAALGKQWYFYHRHTIECPCKRVRADLLELQKEVMR